MITYSCSINDNYLNWFDEDIIGIYSNIFINGKNIYPANIQGLRIVFNKINNELYYEKTIDGDVQFMNNNKLGINDYTVVKFLRDYSVKNTGRPFLIDINYRCGEINKYLLTISINLLSGKYDDDKCYAILSTDYYYDDYSNFKKNKDSVYNLLTGIKTKQGRLSAPYGSLISDFVNMSNNSRRF